ncbi:hypothetical protein Tco_0248159 [Tanacetum coccineum]
MVVTPSPRLDKKEYAYKQKKSFKEELADIDLLLDKGEGNSDILNKRVVISKSLQDIEKLASMEVAQKSGENDVTHDEIKRAVWDCEVDKSPGPDRFTFRFYHRYWSFLEKDVV